MREAILNFGKQFLFQPQMENAGALRPSKKFVVVGMGGSHLAADLLKIWKPDLDILIHEDYGLPQLSEEELQNRLIVLSSYSGNTEEVIDALEAGRGKGLNLAAIAVGGKLLDLAKKNGIPYIQLPDTGIQPRSATGFSWMATLKACGQEYGLKEARTLADSLQPTEYEAEGKGLAEKLRGFVPVIYSSRKNFPLAYNWKIKFNETGKAPAFCNFLPELNHNEMTGFDVVSATRALSEKFYFLFLRDAADDPRIQKRMDITEKLYRSRGFGAENVQVVRLRSPQVAGAMEKIFSASLTGDWTAYYLGENYGEDTENVPMVEEFKKLISNY